MKIVLIGIQGSGKSTQGNLLSKQLKVPYLSTGHIFREISKEKTTLGRYVKEIINAGSLVPDEKTIEIVNTYLSRPEYKKGYILDGFPRTKNQAVKYKNNVDKLIYIEIPDKEALWRLAYRDSEQRDDDTIDAIKRRIELFNTHTRPVLEYYQKKNKLVQIDGTKPIPEVNEEILKSIGKQLIKNHVQSWKQDKKALIAVVGLPGSGKTEAAHYFKMKKLPVISFGKVVNDYVDRNNLDHTGDIHQRVRMEFREKYGFAALAVLNEKKIREKLTNEMVVVIDGMRSWEEYEHVKNAFPDTRVYIVALHADKNVRHARISQREYRNQLGGEERDLKEVIEMHMGPTIALCDYLVKNNYTVKEFQDKLEEVYRSIYYA
jgi:adenylate kinase